MPCASMFEIALSTAACAESDPYGKGIILEEIPLDYRSEKWQVGNWKMGSRKPDGG